MLRAALIGREISYTRSPQIHAAIAEALGLELNFKVCDVPYESLASTAKSLFSECDGFFVTKPYKADIKACLNTVNTKCGVNFVRSSDRAGFNTDGVGFVRAMDAGLGGWRDGVNAALVLGAGGAAYSVAEALTGCGKKVYVLNRTAMSAAKLCNTLGAEMYYNQSCELVVNATSLGLHGEDPMSALCVLPKFEYAFDLVYSPPDTPFLQKNRRSGAKTCNGEDMLLYQAIEGDRIMTGLDFDIADVYAKAKKILDTAD